MATKIINTNKVGNTINFKFVISGVPEWADGVYWGNAEVNGQHVCGTGYSFACPYADNGVDEQAGLEYDEVENLLKTAGIM